ncbi:hypothetical protein [Pandoraea fibrosis]|uniref:Phage protein n=1 Tax=Pandoraea fibrosis TaxID=1891094 RepID=A0A5E4XGG7_9BURK|nr:hypothetical protein [Pandoraea fibrosis]VVE35366.1 phage protein [Pandoraea fibrosis]
MDNADLTGREFLREVDQLVEKLTRDIRAHAFNLDPSPKAVAIRRRRVLGGDFRYFAYTYFPHHIRGESSRFQAFFCERYPRILLSPGGVREWFKAPRGEAKSSLITKVGPCYVVALSLLKIPAVRQATRLDAPPSFIDYITVLGAETTLPTKLIEVVKAELTINAALSLDFPEICGRGPVWRLGEIVTRTGVKIEAFGAEQAIRGTFNGASRPSLLLGDDLITDAEAKSTVEREKRWDWLEKAIDYLGPPDGSVKFLAAGTQLHKDDPISRAGKSIGHVVHHFKAIERLPARMDLWETCELLMRNEDPPVVQALAKRGEVAADAALPSYRFYLDNREAMDEDAVTSWPAVRSLYWLMRQRAKNRRAFNTEMQGVAADGEDGIFAQRTFYVGRLPHWITFGACDPSMGGNERSDPSSLLAGAYDRERQRLQVLDAKIKRRVPSRLEADLIAFQKAHRCVAFAFENNGAFEHSRQTFMTAALRKGVALPLIGVPAKVPMPVRIEGLEPFITDVLEPRITFDPGLTQLLNELDEWPEPQSQHHFDGLCGLVLLWYIAVKRSAVFEYTSAAEYRHTQHGDTLSLDSDDDGLSLYGIGAL